MSKKTGEGQSLNPYSYVLNSPLTLTDPTGLASSNEWVTVYVNSDIAQASSMASERNGGCGGLTVCGIGTTGSAGVGGAGNSGLGPTSIGGLAGRHFGFDTAKEAPKSNLQQTIDDAVQKLSDFNDAVGDQGLMGQAASAAIADPALTAGKAVKAAADGDGSGFAKSAAGIVLNKVAKLFKGATRIFKGAEEATDAAKDIRKAEKGAEKAPRPKGVPEHWKEKPSNKQGGTKYVNPENEHDRVRSMPGNPKSQNPAQQNPYVVRQKDGKFYDADGNLAKDRKDPAAHIPKDDFEFKP